MKKRLRSIKYCISVLCILSLLFPSLVSAARPQEDYMPYTCLKIMKREDYQHAIITEYYPEYNAPHYQLLLPPGFIVTSNMNKVYYLAEVEAEVFAGQTFSQIYVLSERELSIDKKAFYNVSVENIPGSSVTEHTVEFEGGSLRGIGQYAFAEMRVDSDFRISNMNGSVGAGAFENMAVLGTLAIAGNIDTLGAGAFAGAMAGQWEVSAGIRCIEEGAFRGANIKEFTIGDTVASLGSGLFEGSGLTRLYLPDSDFQGEVAEDAFPDKEGLTVVVPGGVTDLSVYHFEQYQNVMFEISPMFPEDSSVVQFLEENHLKWKYGEAGPAGSAEPSPSASAPSVASDEPGTPAPAESAGPVPSAPAGETDAPSATPPAGETDAPSATPPAGNTDAPSATAPAGETGMPIPAGNRNFNRKKIKYRITTGNQVKVQGATDPKILKLNIPDTVAYQGRLYKVTAIKKKAFNKYSHLQQVRVGNYVKSVGDQAFSNCKSLQSISFGRKVTSLGGKILYQDRRLKRILFCGRSLKKIGKKTFQGVPKKVRITAPKNRAEKYRRLIEHSKK